MELSKRTKITLGIATVLEVAFPMLIVFLYMLVFFLTPLMLAINPKSEGVIFGFFFIGMLIFFFFMMFFSIFHIVMKILYLIIVIKNKQITDVNKILFVLGTFYIPFIAMPLYFALNILKENIEDEGMQQAGGAVSPA